MIDGVAMIAAATLAERLAHREPVAVLDVRRAEAWCKDGERIPGAIWIPHDEVARDFRLLDPAFEVPATDGLKVATWAFETTTASCTSAPPGG